MATIKSGKKYTAVLQESCSNGYWYKVYGDTLTELRKNVILKFMKARWHKTADPPIVNVYQTNGNVIARGKFIGRIDIWKQYDPFTAPYVFLWETDNRLIKSNGEIGATYEGYKKMKYKDLVGKYPYW